MRCGHRGRGWQACCGGEDRTSHFRGIPGKVEWRLRKGLWDLGEYVVFTMLSLLRNDDTMWSVETGCARVVLQKSRGIE